MAVITPSYEHSTTMKKLNVNGSIYWLKDNDLRALVETFHDVVFKDVDTTFNESSLNLSTSKATADWVKEKIAGIEGAMHFKGVVPREEGKSDRECIDLFYEGKSEVPKPGDVVIMQDNGLEYICTANSAKTVAGATWEEIGSQQVYETKAHAEATYVPKTRTVAGVDLSDDITAAELKTALSLKALAYKDNASGSVTTADDIAQFSTGKAGEYTVSQTPVAVPATYSSLDVTPAGTIAVNPGTAAAATYEKTISNTIATAAPTGEQTANYTPAGTISKPTITASLDLKEGAVATVTDAGTAYTLTDGSVTKGTDTTSSFVVKGYKIQANATDTEQIDILTLTASDTEFFGNAVTASGDITYTKQTISGALPTFGSKDVVIKTGSSASASLDNAPSFTGTGIFISATPVTSATAADVTQPTFTAEFSGTSKSVTPTVATTVNAAGTDGKVTVASENITPTLNKTSKTVTVS